MNDAMAENKETVKADAGPTRPFSEPHAALTAGGEQPIRLHFSKLDKDLYAHPFVLRTGSRVLANVLQDTAGSSSSVDRSMTIPLDDSGTAAWEDALVLMHPTDPLFKVTWDNAARLLELAHKYDMPYITVRVKDYLQSESPKPSPDSDPSSPVTLLAAQLTDDCALDWLMLTSKCGFEVLANTCIQHILERSLAPTIGLLTAIQPAHTDMLLAGMAQRVKKKGEEADRLRPLAEKAGRLESMLSGAALPATDSGGRPRCDYCRYTWFVKPNGKWAECCLNCGKRG